MTFYYSNVTGYPMAIKIVVNKTIMNEEFAYYSIRSFERWPCEKRYSHSSRQYREYMPKNWKTELQYARAYFDASGYSGKLIRKEK
jgi:hypothetical protein